MFLQEQFQGLCLTCRSNSPDIQYTIKSNTEYLQSFLLEECLEQFYTFKTVSHAFSKNQLINKLNNKFKCVLILQCLCLQFAFENTPKTDVILHLLVLLQPLWVLQ